MCPFRALHCRGRPDPQAPEHEQAARCIQGMAMSLNSLGMDLIANDTRLKPPHPSSTIPEDTPRHMKEELEAHNTSRYCVRPNSGRIEPGHEVEVSGRSTNSNAVAVDVKADHLYVNSPPPSDEARPSRRCQVSRQVSGSVCSHFRRSRVQQRADHREWPFPPNLATSHAQTLTSHAIKVGGCSKVRRPREEDKGQFPPSRWLRACWRRCHACEATPYQRRKFSTIRPTPDPLNHMLTLFLLGRANASTSLLLLSRRAPAHQ